MATTTIASNNVGNNKMMGMQPLKFSLWLFIVSILMIFASMTSAFIVRKGEGNWIIYNIPTVLWVSTIVIVLSSATMHWALLSAKKDDKKNINLGLIVTILLGVVFTITQYLAWNDLVAQKVFFAFANPGGSFFYVLTGLHAFHLISGIIYLLFTLYSGVNNKISSKNLLQIEMCSTYWHFLDALWVYLFVFLLINH
ncbi:MAG: hypothetical protein RLZZ175_1655 [Bacteroidota bacterium]|jgi:cytochrome c oxidase subunit 3